MDTSYFYIVVQSSVLIVYAVIPVNSDIWGRVEGGGKFAILIKIKYVFYYYTEAS